MKKKEWLSIAMSIVAALCVWFVTALGFGEMLKALETLPMDWALKLLAIYLYYRLVKYVYLMVRKATMP
jgi:hypothetical protein